MWFFRQLHISMSGRDWNQYEKGKTILTEDIFDEIVRTIYDITWVFAAAWPVRFCVVVVLRDFFPFPAPLFPFGNIPYLYCCLPSPFPLSFIQTGFNLLTPLTTNKVDSSGLYIYKYRLYSYRKKINSPLIISFLVQFISFLVHFISFLIIFISFTFHHIFSHLHFSCTDQA